MDVQVYPGLATVEALDQQPEILAMQRGTVILGMPVELGQRLAAGGLPERKLAVMIRRRDIDDELESLL